MKQSQFYYLLRRGLFSAGSAIIKNGLVMFNKFTTAGLNFPAQGSAEFNGTSDYIDLGKVNFKTELGITDAFTFSFWGYVNADNAFDPVLSMWTDSPNPSTIFWLGYSNVEGIHYNISLTGGNKSSNILDTTFINEWNHVSAVYDGSNIVFYQNGSQVSTISATGNLKDATNASNFIGDLKIGHQGNSSNYLNGNAANVAIWNRALSSDEINSVMWKSYEGLTDSEENGLQAWYSLDDITSPAASLANMEQLATDKDATIENKAAITAAINALS
jgi:hypothetical protein